MTGIEYVCEAPRGMYRCSGGAFPHPDPENCVYHGKVCRWLSIEDDKYGKSGNVNGEIPAQIPFEYELLTDAEYEQMMKYRPGEYKHRHGSQHKKNHDYQGRRHTGHQKKRWR